MLNWSLLSIFRATATFSFWRCVSQEILNLSQGAVWHEAKLMSPNAGGGVRICLIQKSTICCTDGQQFHVMQQLSYGLPKSMVMRRPWISTESFVKAKYYGVQYYHLPTRLQLLCILVHNI